MKLFYIILFFFIPLVCKGQANLDLTTGNINIYVASGGSSTYNDSASALFEYWTKPIPIALARATSQFYDSIQEYHIDDSLDFLFNFAVNTAGNASYDWIRMGTQATVVNSPTFTAYEGYTTDGASSYIKANYNPGTNAVHWRLNSTCVGQYIRTNDYTNSIRFLGEYDGTNSVQIFIATTNIGNVINGASAVNYAHGGDVTGFTILTRLNATSILVARNSSPYSPISNNSSTIPNQALGIFIGAHNLNGAVNYYAPEQYSFVFGGGQLTETQKTKLYEAMECFMDIFNKGVNP